MKIVNSEVVVSLVLRLGGAGSKFLLFLYLAKRWVPSDLGVLALIIAVIAIGVQVVGMELHYINSRKVAIATKIEVGLLIKKQFKVHVLSYLIAVPILILVFLSGYLEWQYCVPIVLLFISEHLSQEIMRFLQFIYKSNHGAQLLFVRNGLWVFVLIALFEINANDIGVFEVLLCWLVFSMVSVGLGFWYIREYIFTKNVCSDFTYEWVYALIKSAAPFFVSTIFFTFSQYSDRFILNYFEGKDSVGVFFFMASLATVLNMFVTFGVGVFYGPLAIKSFRNEGLDSFRRTRREFMRKSAIYAFFSFFAGCIFIYPTLKYIDKEYYISNIYVYYSLLAANLLVVASDFTNLELYVRGMDKELMWASVFSSTASIFSQTIFIYLYGLNGAIIGAFAFPVYISCTRMYLYRRAVGREPSLAWSARL